MHHCRHSLHQRQGGERWWRTPLIPALRRQKQPDLHEFEASLIYRDSSRTSTANKPVLINLLKKKTRERVHKGCANRQTRVCSASLHPSREMCQGVETAQTCVLHKQVLSRRQAGTFSVLRSVPFTWHFLGTRQKCTRNLVCQCLPQHYSPDPKVT